MNKLETLGIAITQWNKASYTINQLENLLATNEITSIAICDNGSDSVELETLLAFLHERLEHTASATSTKVTIICNTVNSGFSRGTNLAIERLLKQGIDWIWLLNNDTTIQSESLRKCHKLLQREKPGLFGTALTEPGHGDFTGSFEFNRFTTRFSPIIAVSQLQAIPQKQRYICGANLIVHREVFEKVGKLNHNTFLYFEELDLARRALKLGYEQHIIDGPMVMHIGAGSSSASNFDAIRIYNETWSTLDFYWNHEKWLFPLIYIFRTCARIITLLLSKRIKLVTSVLKAVVDFSFKHNSFIRETEVNKTEYFR